MRLAGHEHIRPGGANLRAREREAKAFGRATTISNAALATTLPSGGHRLVLRPRLQHPNPA